MAHSINWRSTDDQALIKLGMLPYRALFVLRNADKVNARAHRMPPLPQSKHSLTTPSVALWCKSVACLLKQAHKITTTHA
jgi:hypothetical protein